MKVKYKYKGEVIAARWDGSLSSFYKVCEEVNLPIDESVLRKAIYFQVKTSTGYRKITEGDWVVRHGDYVNVYSNYEFNELFVVK